MYGIIVTNMTDEPRRWRCRRAVACTASGGFTERYGSSDLFGPKREIIVQGRDNERRNRIGPKDVEPEAHHFQLQGLMKTSNFIEYIHLGPIDLLHTVRLSLQLQKCRISFQIRHKDTEAVRAAESTRQ